MKQNLWNKIYETKSMKYDDEKIDVCTKKVFKCSAKCVGIERNNCPAAGNQNSV